MLLFWNKNSISVLFPFLFYEIDRINPTYVFYLKTGVFQCLVVVVFSVSKIIENGIPRSSVETSLGAHYVKDSLRGSLVGHYETEGS